jgi:SAM-dependent methyltransferase
MADIVARSKVERVTTHSTTWLEHPDGRVRIEPAGSGHRRITVEHPTTFISTPVWETDYPVSLIARILAVKGSSYLCDEIRREEDPNYVTSFLRYSLLGFVAEGEFDGARILDFGSGCGASTVILSRMFPSAHVVGVELVPDFIEIARARAEHYGLDNIELLQSPDPERLPDGIGDFQFVNLGAVYEHLHPRERQRLLPQLWSLLKPGGVLFVNQLPHRYYVIEAHTTGLPLINFLPARVAHLVAVRFSRAVDQNASWPELLRAGIRGGTERSIVCDIRRGGAEPLLLRPTRLGLKSHADLWYAYSTRHRPHPAKRAMRTAFGAISRIAGTSYAPGLSIALRKRG